MIYHIKMSNGVNLDIEAENAADAIQDALENEWGSCVVSCYAGNTEDGFYSGRINYDIPKHSPLPK